MNTVSERVLAYGAELGQLLVRRELAGGLLSDEEEEATAKVLHDLQHQMSVEEEAVIAHTIACIVELRFQCAYCEAKAENRATLAEHVRNCPKHPVHIERERADRAERDLGAVRIALDGAIRAAVIGGAEIVEMPSERTEREATDQLIRAVRTMVEDKRVAAFGAIATEQFNAVVEALRIHPRASSTKREPQ